MLHRDEGITKQAIIFLGIASSNSFHTAHCKMDSYKDIDQGNFKDRRSIQLFMTSLAHR